MCDFIHNAWLLDELLVWIWMQGSDDEFTEGTGSPASWDKSMGIGVLRHIEKSDSLDSYTSTIKNKKITNIVQKYC